MGLVVSLAAAGPAERPAGPEREVLPVAAAAGASCELELVYEGPSECLLASDPVIEGDMLYMSMGRDFCPGQRGLRIYDISDPHQPRERGHLPTEWGSVAIRGELAAVMDGFFRTIDVSDPDAPRQLAEMRLSDWVGAVMIVGDTAFVTARETGLLIIDISNPASPSVISSLKAPGLATHVAVDGDVLYMTLREPVAGVRIVDISDLRNPVEMTFFETGAYASSVTLHDGFAYVGTDRLLVLDVHDPQEPVEVATLLVPGAPRSLVVEPPILWLTAAWAGEGELVAVDISDPRAPARLGGLDFSRENLHLLMAAKRGSTAYVIQHWGATAPELQSQLNAVDLSACAVCEADCDRSGSLDFFDFLCFQNLFAAANPRADCDGSGELDVFDFLCFQNQFAAGCP